MIQAPLNNLLIQISTKYISNISSIMKVAAIENISNVDPTDLVQIVGTVVSVPKKITNEVRGYEGYSTKDIQIGDTVIFRFDVIYSFVQKKPNTDKVYKNRIWYNGQEYWLCDIQKVFGVIRNGEIIMVNGYVMLTDFEVPKIILSAGSSKSRNAQDSQIMHIGSPKTTENEIYAQMGDNVFYNPISAAKYQINGKPFRIIQQDKLLGKELI
jgi:co-chaperonin GroES (HSP10)